jgi:hypothetical protein
MIKGGKGRRGKKGSDEDEDSYYDSMDYGDEFND